MITLSKLAELAHVSISTASKAFSGSREVNEQTREQIFRIAKEYGVFKKFYNAKYPRLVIAVVVPEFHSGHYSALLSELQGRLHEKGCTLSVTASDFLKGETEKICDYYSHYTDADGVILIEGSLPSQMDFSVPAVIIGRAEKVIDMPHVTICTEEAMREALVYVKKRGASSVGFISEKKTVSRLEKFVALAEEVYGVADETYTVMSDLRFEEAGYEGMERLLKEDRVPRVLFCGYDEIAFGALRCLSDHGLSVPRDVALVGFNDNKVSRYTVPSLSTIDIKHAECAALAVDTLLEKIFSGAVEATEIVQASFCPRESSDI